MGRMRIKKKDAVIPFRQTLAYRLLLAMASVMIFMTTVFFLIAYARSGYTVGIVASVAGAVMSATAVFYNIGEVRNAKVPAATLKRARRK